MLSQSLEEALNALKQLDNDALLEMAYNNMNAINKFFLQQRPVGEHTIKIILYPSNDSVNDWLKTLLDCIYALDDIKVKPKNKKLSKAVINNNLFHPYIDNEEADKIKRVYNSCVKSGLPKIPNFSKNLPSYVDKLATIYSKYEAQITPLLADKKEHEKEEYKSLINSIFNIN